MANKEYKDFTAGAYGNDQIMPQQSTSDDSYTKVPVPTFGLGDNVANEPRTFETNGQGVTIQANDPTSGGESSEMFVFNGDAGFLSTDTDSAINTALDVFTDRCHIKAEYPSVGSYSEQTTNIDHFQAVALDGASNDNSIITVAADNFSLVSTHNATGAQGSCIVQSSQAYLQTFNFPVSAIVELKPTGVKIGIATGTKIEIIQSTDYVQIEASLLNLNNIQEFATNALAIAGGLATNDVYHTAGIVKVVI